MNSQAVINLLEGLARRLGTLADQAQEARRQAQHVQDRVMRLHAEVERLKQDLVSLADTAPHKALAMKGEGRPAQGVAGPAS
jgi:hypothetical protein